MYAVILAGGGGTRLWPLSRPDRPKPFLPLLGERTLLRATFERLVPELLAAADVVVVTDRRYAALVLEELPELDRAQVLGEPTGRNTAAAIAYAAAALERPPDDVMLVLPADHLVRDEGTFRALLRDAAGLAAEAAPGTGLPSLVTLGIAPTGPETGYGYIVTAGPRAGAPGADAPGGRAPGATAQPADLPTGRSATSGAFEVARFVEKPSADAAAALLAGPATVAWNAGIFAWRRDSILAALAAHAPDILAAVEAGVRAIAGAPAALDAAYATLRATSIDYAVMEPASQVGNVAMVGADVGWSDLGSWAALRDALVAEAVAAGEPAGVVGFGARRDRGSESTLVMSGGRLVVTIGLRDTIVVDTPDALLVCAADRSQEVRAIAEELARAREEDT
ncbi:MAG TPA: sugar phosphate nucleotidyltransferase [Candidatus Limnocylindrales bacterium]